MPFHGLLNMLYVLIKWFYTCVYFYFYTFAIIILPMAQILIEKE